MGNLVVFIQTLQQILVKFTGMLSWKGFLKGFDCVDLGLKVKVINQGHNKIQTQKLTLVTFNKDLVYNNRDNYLGMFRLRSH